jgi:hypothetical protein
VEFLVCRCRTVASITVPTWRGTLEPPKSKTAASATTLPVEVTYEQVVGALAAAHCQWNPLQATPGQCGLRTPAEQLDV